MSSVGLQSGVRKHSEVGIGNLVRIVSLTFGLWHKSLPIGALWCADKDRYLKVLCDSA